MSPLVNAVHTLMMETARNDGDNNGDNDND